eukprot:11214462-Lingulodinium_polyedra.AAC.1
MAQSSSSTAQRGTDRPPHRSHQAAKIERVSTLPYNATAGQAGTAASAASMPTKPGPGSGRAVAPS